MICDKLNNLKIYEKIDRDFALAASFLEGLSIDCECGRYDLSPTCFVSISEYDTVPLCTKEFESHKRYIDLQYIISGTELFSWAEVSQLKLSRPFGDTDCAFYELGAAPNRMWLSAGDFAIFFPDDAHAPCGCEAEPCHVKKAVVKIECK